MSRTDTTSSQDLTALRIALCVREVDELQTLRAQFKNLLPRCFPLKIGGFYEIDSKFTTRYDSETGIDMCEVGLKYTFDSSWHLGIIQYEGTVETCDKYGATGVFPVRGGVFYRFLMRTDKLLMPGRKFGKISHLHLELHELIELRLREGGRTWDDAAFVKNPLIPHVDAGYEDNGMMRPRFDTGYAVGAVCRVGPDGKPEKQILRDVKSPRRLWFWLHKDPEFRDRFPREAVDEDIEAMKQCLVKSAHAPRGDHGGATPFTHKGLAFFHDEDDCNIYSEHNEQTAYAESSADSEAFSSSDSDESEED